MFTSLTSRSNGRLQQQLPRLHAVGRARPAICQRCMWALDLEGALDLAGLDAARADVQALGGAGHDRPDLLNVRVPALGGAAVGVGDLHAEERLLPADVADGGHGPTRVADAFGPAAGRAISA